jgi:hypothetical protein
MFFFSVLETKKAGSKKKNGSISREKKAQITKGKMTTKRK